MALMPSSATVTINADTEEGEARQERNEEEKRDTKDTHEGEVEGEKSEEEDLLEIAGARGRWTQRIFLLCASS